MRATGRFLVLCAFLTIPSLARANVPILTGQSQLDHVQIQFIYSKALFVDSLVLNTTATTPLQACPYGLYNGGTVSNCVFDEGECDQNIGTQPQFYCFNQPFPNDFTCDCNSNSPFIDLGTLGNLSGATQATLDFQLYVATDRTAVTNNKVAYDIVYDADPASANNHLAATDTNPTFAHLRATPLDCPGGQTCTTGAVWLLEWEDGVSGGDADYNDLVAIVRSVPQDCVNSASAFCLQAAYTGTDTRFSTHVTAEDAQLGTSGFRVETTYFNATNAPTNVAVCQELHFDFNSAATELIYGAHYDNNGNYVCDNGGGPNGTIGSDTPFLALSADGAELTPANSTCSPEARTDPYYDNLSLPANNGVIQAGTTVSYPNPNATNPKYLYDTFDSYQTNAANLIRDPNNGIYQNLTTIRKALYTVDTANLNPIAPLTAHIYVNHYDTAGFRCPSGANVKYAGQTSNDKWYPEMAKVQTVPDVVAVNSPVDLVIPTVPTGYEGPTDTVQAFMVFTWTDNLAQIAPGLPALSGFISSTALDGSALNSFNSATEPFLVGGGANKGIKVHLALPNGLPEGFRAQLVAVLVNKATGENLIISTYPLAKDHTPPTVSSAATVRTQSGVTATVTASDPWSGLGIAAIVPSIDNATLPGDVMHLISGDYYGPTTLTATQAAAASSVVALDLSIDDTHFNNAPTLRLPVADTGGDRNVECNAYNSATVTLDGSGSTGPSDVPVSYQWSGPFGTASGVSVTETLPYGPNDVTLALTDGRGFTGTQTSTLTVGDTTPPTLTASVAQSCLWPVNHKLVPYALGSDIQYTVSDVCDPNPQVRIVNVTSTDGEAPLFDATHLCLRAERNGEDTGGNVYTITLQATDAHGNSTLKTVQVTVPHDGGCSGPAPTFVDDSDPRCQF